MPRSKRNKVVSLTKTASKGRTLKSKLIDELRQAVDEYERIYVFSFDNLRAAAFKDIRMEWRDSKIFMGKNKVAQIAFGRTPEEEYKGNLRNISDLLQGNVGILFTNKSKKDVKKYFKNFSSLDYAKAGTIANEDFVLEPGPLTFPVSMIDELRKLGMVVEADNGTVQLRSKVVVQSSGAAITPEQAKILVKLEKRTVTMKIALVAEWADESFTEM